jgi:hypothetical protein
VADGELALLRARARSKRFVAAGIVLALYAAGWLVFAWRASRIGETECTVVQGKDVGGCSVQHTLGGEPHLLPYEPCGLSERWPYQPPGSTLHCYFYRNDPDDIFVKPRKHRWLTPVPPVLLGVGLALLGYGVIVRVRARAPAQGLARAPYRAAFQPPTELPPLIVPLSESHWGRWVGGGFLLLLGLTLASLFGWLSWTRGGDFGVGDLGLLALSHGVTLWGAVAMFHRSALALDRERCVYWWGFIRPWFHRYGSVDALTHVEAVREGGGRSASYYVVLHFSDDKPWKLERPSRSESEHMTGLVADYLKAIRSQP